MENTTLPHCKKPEGTTAMLTAYPTVYDSLSTWYGWQMVTQKPHRNRHFSESQMGDNGFRGHASSSPHLDAARSQWANLLRTTMSSMAIMMNHVHVAVSTLKISHL